jgi:3D (Asp-Asp-Asp) domain-containing protein
MDGDMKARLPILILLAAILGAGPACAKERRATPMKATAYARRGTTKSGEKTRRGIVAADPKVLPLGTKVKVENAGKYSGHYVVKDTGRKIKGRKIDLFVPSHREARQFGKKDVRVKVVQPAPNRQN